MNEVVSFAAAVVTAIIGVAILAVLVSPNSQTAGVIQAATGGFSSILSTALSPVSGSGGGGGNFSSITGSGGGFQL